MNIMMFGEEARMTNKTGAKNPFYFVDYDKISDVLLRFDRNYYLKFNVKLSWVDKDGNRIPFHSEYKSYTNARGDLYTIRREYFVHYSIESNDKSIKNNYVSLFPNDVYVLNMLINNNILPWYVGDNKIFGKDGDDQLCIKFRDIEKVYLPLTGGQFLSFYPTVINYEVDNTSKEGIIIEMNQDGVGFQTTVDKFFHFAYIIRNTDMYSMAAAMIDYVKIKPYLLNFKDTSNF